LEFFSHVSLLAKIRAVFTLGQGVVRGISELTAEADPVAFFKRWFDEACRAGIFDPDAMNVATSTADGVPSARVLLLKGCDQRGFVFFTHYDSRKSQELAENPHVALVFYWSVLERQVRVEGKAERLSEQESFDYFKTRPRGSRIGAWASDQSAPLAGREALEERVREYEEKFRGEDVPLPPFWGGYRVIPHRIEFWQGRINRLHDRLCYTREGNDWKVTRLYP
jgi:pyridoxamine 5'-phosphate oxidase